MLHTDSYPMHIKLSNYNFNRTLMLPILTSKLTNQLSTKPQRHIRFNVSAAFSTFVSASANNLKLSSPPHIQKFL